MQYDAVQEQPRCLGSGDMYFRLSRGYLEGGQHIKITYSFPASLGSHQPVQEVQVNLLPVDARDVFESSPEI